MCHLVEGNDAGTGAGSVWEISVSCIQFCCEPKTSFKNLSFSKNIVTHNINKNSAGGMNMEVERDQECHGSENPHQVKNIQSRGGG